MKRFWRILKCNEKFPTIPSSDLDGKSTVIINLDIEIVFGDTRNVNLQLELFIVIDQFVTLMRWSITHDLLLLLLAASIDDHVIDHVKHALCDYAFPFKPH